MFYIAKDKMEKEFLFKIHKIAEQHYRKNLNKFNASKKTIICESQDSLELSVKQLCLKYKDFQLSEKTEQMRYVYLSFLRSSILDRRKWFRLDAYDFRNRASIIECSVSWEFEEMTNCMYTIVDVIRQEFKKQTIVKEYELDAIQYKLAEQIYAEYNQLIPEILERVLMNAGIELFGDNCVDFLSGEFLDKSQLLFRWDHGTITTAEQCRIKEESKTLLLWSQ